MNALSVRSRLSGMSRPVLALMAIVLVAGLLLGATSNAAAQSGYGSASGGTTYALNTSGELVGFDRSTSSQIDSRVAVSGLAQGESLVGIDFRPATGELYGVGSTSQLYTIDPASGAATAVAPLSVALQGNVFGVDFNPSADALRIVSDTSQNLRVDVETGETTVDGTLAYAPGDPNAGVSPNVVDGAYANNLPDVENTALYDFDLATGNYVQQDPPNDGVLNTIGPLSPGFTTLTGFDITSLGGSDRGFAAIQSAEGQPSVLYSVDVVSGATSQIGTIGGGEYVSDLAIPTTQMDEMDALPDTGGPSVGALATVALFGGLALLAAGFSARALVRRNSA
ncbi:DUF4394 domain-containing protein [Rubrobacter aplysinae]|uniref:DUF4394 domain-containing protein n=1 Tax=Rubrobacter aplysinae TaxID=909625 RepID=UPI00069E4F99|nr:DUF4394 domain-containing protein [Rubrobacter aplysinae]